MKNTIKTLIASIAILGVTGMAQADPAVTVTEADMYSTNLEPGYADTIDMASVPALDTTIAVIPEFEQPNNFMSDEGVYRYAYYEKTGMWITLDEARAALMSETPLENL